MLKGSLNSVKKTRATSAKNDGGVHSKVIRARRMVSSWRRKYSTKVSPEKNKNHINGEHVGEEEHTACDIAGQQNVAK